ncbi:hypothetical protein Tco_0749611 [Tanacetum coccineum]|uniref:Tf2-1-like SH3-like domain-containing protein n=1 Tax=Tanacetum coccineum TaxID=301880 RepID=A0ABQ4YZ64_9ASTR
MCQKRWIELFGDYECEHRYHQRKANVVADALSKMSKMENMTVEMLRGMDQLIQKKEDGGMNFIWVPLIDDVRTLIMDEAYASRYLVKAEHQRPSGLLQQPEMPVRGMILAAQSEAFKQENTLQKALGTRLDSVRLIILKWMDKVSVRFGLWKETTDKVVVIKEKLQAARDRQKSYADSGRKMTEYEVGENVLLKVSPWKGVMRFGKKGKLALRYVGPFEILERIGPVAYQLRLPEELIGVHDTFHVSNLKKCLGNAILHVPLNEIKIDKTLRFVEEPIEIMDREVKSLKHSRIPLVKVRWNSECGTEFTWEREDCMKSKYPQLFIDRAVEPTS